MLIVFGLFQRRRINLLMEDIRWLIARLPGKCIAKNGRREYTDMVRSD